MLERKNVGERGSRISIVVIDDHPAIQDALASLIRNKIDLEYRGSAATINEAISLIRSERPDVAIIDVTLGEGNGFDLLDYIKKYYPSVHAIIFSMYDENVYAERAISAGASGYVMKTATTQTLVEAIRRVVKGEVYLSPTLASVLVRRATRKRTQNLGFSTDTFTGQERAVFELLGEGYNIEEIADLLNLTVKTVATYRRHAKEKLGYESVSQLVRHAAEWRMVSMDKRTSGIALESTSGQ